MWLDAVDESSADPCHLVGQVNQIQRLTSNSTGCNLTAGPVRIWFTCRASRQGPYRIRWCRV